MEKIYSPARFPRVEAYFLFALALWACLSFASGWASRLPPQSLYEFSLARFFAAVSGDQFHVPTLRSGQLKLIKSSSYTEALSDLAKGSQGDKQLAKRVRLHTTLILLWWPILSVALASCLAYLRWRLRNSQGDPSAGVKNQIRGTVVLKPRRTLWQKIFGD
jgi:nitrate reductase NapE component